MLHTGLSYAYMKPYPVTLKGPGEVSPIMHQAVPHHTQTQSQTHVFLNSWVGWEHGTPTARKAIAGGYHRNIHFST